MNNGPTPKARPLGNLHDASGRLLADSMRFIAHFRRELAESMNQILHQHAILAAASTVRSRVENPDELEWFWHPAQTSADGEADLVARRGSECVIQAEVTTSPKPIGTIDRRMATTLRNLSEMPGRMKFYCVVSEEMATRAQTKIDKAGYDIEVLPLELPELLDTRRHEVQPGNHPIS